MAKTSASVPLTGMGSTMTDMAMPSSTAAAAAAAAGDMGGSCKISMLWNWYTVDSCFIARSWRVESQRAFAGWCVGVIVLVMLVEALGRAGKEYDRYIVGQDVKKQKMTTASPLVTCGRFRPNVVQQGMRALLHMLQWAVAYFVMLLAMYHNGYVMMSILIGAYMGYFMFGYESLQLAVGREGQDGVQDKATTTVCCGWGAKEVVACAKFVPKALQWGSDKFVLAVEIAFWTLVRGIVVIILWTEGWA
ncbi:Copper Transporter integral membrane protein that functions in high affinity copper transport [Pleosporales sp. CAS-2024a]